MLKKGSNHKNKKFVFLMSMNKKETLTQSKKVNIKESSKCR